MAFLAQRQKRKKQVNVRLNATDAERFQEVMDFNLHQSGSDSVRDMIRSAYLDFQKRTQREIDKIMNNIPKTGGGESRVNQLNVRLSPDEIDMSEFLIEKMRCKNTSEMARNLINIFYVDTVENKKGKARKQG